MTDRNNQIERLKTLKAQTAQAYVSEYMEMRTARLSQKGQTARVIDSDPSVIAVGSQVTGFLLGVTAAIELLEHGVITTTLSPEVSTQ